MAYQTTLNGDPKQQRRAAKTVLVIAGQQSGDRLAAQIAHSGAGVDILRLSDILSDALDLATASLSDVPSEEPDFRHAMNVAWLAELYAASHCRNSDAHASLTPAGDAEARAHLRAPGIGGDMLAARASTVAMAGLALLAAGAIGGYVVVRAPPMRKRQVERQPRFPISLRLDLTFTTPEGELKEAWGEALDISQGGLKIRWDDPPPPDTLTSLTLLGITRLSRIVWSNHHFAGLMFEVGLTKAELKSLKEANAPP